MRIAKSMVVWSTLIIGCFLLGGCCTLMNGTTQEITFKSQPEGANVDFNGRILGKTPLTITLDKKPLAVSEDPKFIFSMDGYENVTIPIDKRGCGGCMIGNGVLGGFTGLIPIFIYMAIDGSTGAGIEYSLNQYNALLLTKEQSVNMSQSDIAKQYIVSNYGYIVSELAEKPGMYVDGLVGLLDMPKNDKPTAIETIKKLSSDDKDVFKFADNVVTQFGTK